MGLLRDIQNSLVDPSKDLGTTLRQCKILAARLRSKPLADWLIWEANGYPLEVPVPSYRTWPLTLTGNFVGRFGAAIRNVGIPIFLLPEKLQDRFAHYENRQSVVEIEQIISTMTESQEGSLHVPANDLAPFLSNKVYVGYNCLSVEATFGVAHAVGLLNSVRNRMLDFTLALEQEDPIAGQEPSPDAALSSSAVRQIFNTTVSGGAAHVAGTQIGASVSINVTPGDFKSLERTLLGIGVSEELIPELKSAIKEDPKPTSVTNLGSKVSAWLGKITSAAAVSGVPLATKAILEAIAKHYGLSLT